MYFFFFLFFFFGVSTRQPNFKWQQSIDLPISQNEKNYGWLERSTNQSKREEEHHDKEQAQLFSFCFFPGTEMAHFDQSENYWLPSSIKGARAETKKTYPTLNLSLSLSSYLYGITELCKDTWYLRSGCRLWLYQVSHRNNTLSYFFWTVRSQISSIWLPLLLQTYWFKPYLLSLCNFPQSQTITFPCTPPLPPYRRQPNMAPWILQTHLCLPS